MKKFIKFIATLLCISIAAVTAFIVTINIRGNFDDYDLPKGFNESLKNSDTARSSDAYARIMSANLLVNYESWGGTDAHKRAKMFIDIINEYEPDVIAVQEMSDQWYCCITKNRGNYQLVYPVSSGAMFHMTGLIYNSETVNLIEHGRMEYTQGDNPRLRRIVWGLFEDKGTKNRYIVTSTHLDLIREGQEKSQLEVMRVQADEQIKLSKELYKRYKCPVLSAGDFNAMDGGGYNDPFFAPSIYDKIAASLTDTKSIAKSKTSGNSRNVNKPTFDHIFLKGNVTVTRYGILSDKVMEQMSDHFPVFADITN